MYALFWGHTRRTRSKEESEEQEEQEERTMKNDEDMCTHIQMPTCTVFLVRSFLKPCQSTKIHMRDSSNDKFELKRGTFKKHEQKQQKKVFFLF